MQKIYIIFTYTFICLLIFSINAGAKSNIDVNTLIEKGKLFNNKDVIIQGEAVGEPMKRKDYVWININDNANDIGIVISKENMSKIKYYGNNKKKGDIIKIYGKYFEDAEQFQGDTCIQADKIEIVKRGYYIHEKIDYNKVRLALALTLIFIFSTVFGYKKLKN